MILLDGKIRLIEGRVFCGQHCELFDSKKTTNTQNYDMTQRTVTQTGKYNISEGGSIQVGAFRNSGIGDVVYSGEGAAYLDKSQNTWIDGFSNLVGEFASSALSFVTGNNNNVQSLSSMNYNPVNIVKTGNYGGGTVSDIGLTSSAGGGGVGQNQTNKWLLIIGAVIVVMYFWKGRK